jgi:predicted RNA-binding protein
MCEANAYILRDDKQDEGGFLLVDIFGTQKIIKGKIKQMNLVDHKIIFEE